VSSIKHIRQRASIRLALPLLLARPDLLLPLPQLLALLDTKPIPEHQLDLLQAQARRFREAREDEEPAEETHARVEPKGACRGDLRHEREIRGADEQVARPVGRRGERGADAAYW
jgi:hypothetical protein